MSEGGTREDPGRRLVLLRHGKSDWPDVADHERPLAKRGRRDAPEAGRWLAESGYAPDAVVCSTALRARETWALAEDGLLAAGRLAAGPLAAGLRAEGPGVPPAPSLSPTVRYDRRVYGATVLGLLMLIREFEPRWRTAMIVGHNPGLAELAMGLAGPSPEPPPAFPTAAVAVLGLPGAWAEAEPGKARLLAFTVPADR